MRSPVQTDNAPALQERPALLCALPQPWRDYYLEGFKVLLPSIEVFVPEQCPPPERVRYAFVLQPPPGLLASFPNLKAILPVGAGVEHVLADPDLPEVPIVRMIQPDMIQRMTEYIVQHALNHLRKFRQIRAAQSRAQWELIINAPANETTVGILGFGELGQHAARALAAIGFKVIGWSRTSKTMAGFGTYAGDGSLPKFLGSSDILVCLLPLTSETDGLIDRNFLSQTKPGSSFINASRGRIVKDADLLECLDSGQLREATLDAFDPEPLPPQHPFWRHPNVTVTPHCASAATVEAVATRITQLVETLERGGEVGPLVDRARGY